MDKAEFWQLIETAKAQGQGDYETHYAALEALVTALPAEEIADYVRIVEECQAQAYSWDLWAAAYIINGGCSDDCFDYFRNWVIVQGEEFFNRTLADPGSLVDAPIDPNEPDVEFEGLLGIGLEAYEAKTGHDLPPLPPDQQWLRRGPIGEPWEEDEVETRWPQLAAKFGY